VACIFGKFCDLRVKYALKTTNEENLKMIFDNIAFLKSEKFEVIFDTEHYFDSYRNNKKNMLLKNSGRIQPVSAKQTAECFFPIYQRRRR
jgi:isopropylmalate/homocitrate/citramalate synthase